LATRKSTDQRRCVQQEIDTQWTPPIKTIDKSNPVVGGALSWFIRALRIFFGCHFKSAHLRGDWRLNVLGLGHAKLLYFGSKQLQSSSKFRSWQQ
jgi:hypothetical protein